MLAIGALFLGGCGIVVNDGTVEPTRTDTAQEPDPAGGIAYPDDGVIVPDAPSADADARGDTADTRETEWIPPDAPAGDIQFSFDSGTFDSGAVDGGPPGDASPSDADPPKD